MTNNKKNNHSFNGNLVWMDLEMTGLEPETDKIIELAAVVTDSQLNVIAVGPVIVVHQSNEVLNNMDDWNKKHHAESGLIEKIKNSSYNIEQAENAILEFIKKHVKEKESPLCGNTIYQDRIFLHRYMKKLETFLHYRNIDVSSFKEIVYRWYKDLPEFKKENKHTALEDIQESINELKYYRKWIFPEKCLTSIK